MYTYLILVTLARIINKWSNDPWSNEQWIILRLYIHAFNEYIDRNSKFV